MYCNKLFNFVLEMSLYGRQMDTERGLYYLELREGISNQIQVITVRISYR